MGEQCLRTHRILPLDHLFLYKGADTNYTAVYLVKGFTKHSSYSSTTNLNDIGLVETQTSILFSRAVAPVCLPFYYSSADFAGQVVTATGFGSTSFGGPSSNVLLKVNLNVLGNTNTQCKGTYPSISSSQMCSFTSQKDTCQVGFSTKNSKRQWSWTSFSLCSTIPVVLYSSADPLILDFS